MIFTGIHLPQNPELRILETKMSFPTCGRPTEGWKVKQKPQRESEQWNKRMEAKKPESSQTLLLLFFTKLTELERRNPFGRGPCAQASNLLNAEVHPNKAREPRHVLPFFRLGSRIVLSINSKTVSGSIQLPSQCSGWLGRLKINMTSWKRP